MDFNAVRVRAGCRFARLAPSFARSRQRFEDGGSRRLERFVELARVASARLREPRFPSSSAAARLGGGAEHGARLEPSGFLRALVKDGDEPNLPVGGSRPEHHRDARLVRLARERLLERFRRRLERRRVHLVEPRDEHALSAGGGDGVGDERRGFRGGEFGAKRLRLLLGGSKVVLDGGDASCDLSGARGVRRRGR